MTFPTFSSGEVLRAQDMNAVGLWLVKTVTVGAGVTSVPVTGAFSSDYNNYRVEIGNVDASSAGAFVYITFGSQINSQYGSISFDNFNGVSSGVTRQNNTGLIEIGVTGTNNDTSSCFDIQSPNLASATNLSGTYNGGGWSGYFGGLVNTITQYTSFTISVQSPATLTGGTIRVYGYRN
jgi:hypothetical protein